jgi:subtilase family serine protease
MDSAWDTADVILADVAVSALAAAATKTSSVSVTIPTTVAGTMYIIAKADSADEVAEGSETNNTTYRAYTFKPDLVISVLTGPSTTTPGTTIAMTVTTKNLGALSPSSTTGLYLSANTAWDAADTFLGDLAMSGLAFAATETGSISVMIPAAASGTMYIIAKADSAGIVTESSETNNTLYRNLAVNQ